MLVIAHYVERFVRVLRSTPQTYCSLPGMARAHITFAPQASAAALAAAPLARPREEEARAFVNL